MQISTTGTAYRREVDGLRALAVVPVILFHADFSWFAGGFVGVDVFFVISGYLITRILLDQLSRGTYSLASFYERRARRILPAFVVMMLTCLLAALIVMLPGEFEKFIQSAIASALGISNFYFLSKTGYFAQDADLQPLLHTWSLGIEEQYYLVFPPLLALLTSRIPQKRGRILVAMTVIGFAFAEIARHFDPQRSFFFTLTRTWELGLGSLCALYATNRQPRANEALSLGGLVLIVLSIACFDSSVPFPSVYALAPTLGACLVLLFSSGETWVGRLLSVRPLVGIGLISYSAYLWHQPIFAFSRLISEVPPSHWHMAGLAILSLVVGWASWRWIEQPFRSSGHQLLPERRRLLGASAAAIVLLVALGGAGIQFQDARRDVWLRLHPEISQAYMLQAKAQEYRDYAETDERNSSPSDCRFNTMTIDQPVARRLDACHKRFGPGVLLLGDSHAVDFYGVLASRYDIPFLVGITQHGCRAGDPEPEPELDCPYDEVLTYLSGKSADAVRLILYTQAGFYMLQTADDQPVHRKFFERVAMGEALPATEPDTASINAALAYLNELGRSTKVKWVGPRTEPHVPFNYFAKFGCTAPITLRPGQREAFQQLDDFISDRIDSTLNVSYVSQNAIIGFDWTKDYSDCRDLFFVDGDHYSAAGERRFGSRLPASLLQ
jgi:peptidoglycan/LPS O-acetylase OafA/YrhL